MSTNLSIAPLTIAVLKGLLTPIMEAPVNYVNAPIVAKERGIEVKEVKSTDAGDFTSLIRVRVEAGKRSHLVAGTLYHKKEPRVVEIDQFKVEMVPEGHMLLIHNIDRPGVIGMVGKVLGDNSINIVRMQCALEKRGGNALLIIGSDQAFPGAVLDTIKSSQRHSVGQSRCSVLDVSSLNVPSLISPDIRAPTVHHGHCSSEAAPSSGHVASSRERSLVPVGHGDDPAACRQTGPPSRGSAARADVDAGATTRSFSRHSSTSMCWRPDSKQSCWKPAISSSIERRAGRCCYVPTPRLRWRGRSAWA